MDSAGQELSGKQPPHSRGRWSGRPLLVVTSAALFGLLLACKSGKPEGGGAENAAARPIPVLTTGVEKRDLPIYLDGLGSVVAYKTVTVRTQVDGRLERVLFREGQRVAKGELLAQVDARPFLATLHQAESALARDTALLANARKNLERYSELSSQKLISQQQVDDQQAQASQYEGAVGVDRAAAEAARLNVEYSRIVAPIDGVTGVRLVDEGNLVRASDASGLVVITQMDPIAVIFTLPEDDLPRIVTRLGPSLLSGDAATGKTAPGPGDKPANDKPASGKPAPPAAQPPGPPVEAWSRDGQTRLGIGELVVLDNQINQGTATLRLKAVFKNPERRLWPNQFVKARLLLSTQSQALVVPAVAVQRGPKGTFVYVVAEDGTASPRPVEVELITGDQAVLARGVRPGEQIVVEGQSQLRPGAKVAARPVGGGEPKTGADPKANGEGGGRSGGRGRARAGAEGGVEGAAGEGSERAGGRGNAGRGQTP